VVEAAEPATLEVRIQAVFNGRTYDLGTATATDTDITGQITGPVAGLLRAVASELETRDHPRPRPDAPAATPTEL
jgi:hypothetical protein